MSPEAVAAIVGMLERNWGSYGYRFERFELLDWSGATRGHVVCSDGSRFSIAADKYGNELVSVSA